MTNNMSTLFKYQLMFFALIQKKTFLNQYVLYIILNQKPILLYVNIFIKIISKKWLIHYY